MAMKQNRRAFSKRYGYEENQAWVNEENGDFSYGYEAK